MSASAMTDHRPREFRLRHFMFYVDLIRIPFLCLRLLLLPKDRPVVLAFFLNKTEAEHLLPAISPGAALLRINYPRKGRGWRAVDFDWLMRILSRFTQGRRVSIVIWGYRDRINHGRCSDISCYFASSYRLERALVRPAQVPPNGAHTAFIVGRNSIYFDGRISTDFEQALNRIIPGQLTQSAEGQRLLDHVLKGNLTKYPLMERQHQNISAQDLLIVGQCTGDQAIEETEALAKTNPGLIQLVAEHILATSEYRNVYFKPHPRSSTTAADLAYLHAHHPTMEVIDAGIGIVPLLAAKPTVATLTSGVGLEAALRGCKVHCFGVAFYSNWGFTVDYLPCPRRTNQLSAEDVFLYMLMEQTVYVDWRTAKRVSAAEAFLLN